MRFFFVLALAATLPLSGAVIDVSRETEVNLKTGEAVAFTFVSSYSAHAGAYGAPATPGVISFTLLSASFGTGASLTATLESADRAYASEFGTVLFQPAYVRSSAYTGAAEAASGSDRLSPEDGAVFSGPVAVLVLRNIGPEIALGLPAWSLAKALQISVSGGPLSVGGAVTAVSLERESLMGAKLLAAFPDEPPAGAEIPEPGSLLLFAGGALLLTFHPVRRFVKSRIQ